MWVLSIIADGDRQSAGINGNSNLIFLLRLASPDVVRSGSGVKGFGTQVMVRLGHVERDEAGVRLRKRESPVSVLGSGECALRVEWVAGIVKRVDTNQGIIGTVASGRWWKCR